MNSTQRRHAIFFRLLKYKKLHCRELAAEFGVSERTIRRDIDDLSRRGLPVTTNSGNQGGIFLIEGYNQDVCHLTEEQAELLERLRETMNKEHQWLIDGFIDLRFMNPD